LIAAIAVLCIYTAIEPSTDTPMMQWVDKQYEQQVQLPEERIHDLSRQRRRLIEGGINLKVQRQAIQSWARSLKAEDYDPDSWATRFHSHPADYFEYYADRLSTIYGELRAFINFALVGACDGTNDRTIRDKFLKYDHWRGVFVEPFQLNFRDLSLFMESHKVSHRTHLIHAAATSRCNSSTIKMKRPTFEEQNKSLPHWMRRQIGAVVPLNKLSRPMTGGWVAEFVRCVTGTDILMDWTSEINRQGAVSAGRGGAGGPGKLKLIRPHVLKVDVEGHDYDVLMGFLGEEVPQSVLPLMINFEAKSITTKFELLKTNMQSRGYVVSNFATGEFVHCTAYMTMIYDMI